MGKERLLDLFNETKNVLYARTYNLYLYKPKDVNFSELFSSNDMLTYINNPKNHILYYFTFEEDFLCFEFLQEDTINWYSNKGYWGQHEIIEKIVAMYCRRFKGLYCKINGGTYRIYKVTSEPNNHIDINLDGVGHRNVISIITKEIKYKKKEWLL